MTGARYGALGRPDEDKQSLADFITVGLSAEEERPIGARPTGRGVLGLLIADPQTLRVTEIGQPSRQLRVPAQPPADDLVPRRADQGARRGLREPLPGRQGGWSEFTRDDEALVEALSLAAGIAIENARLHERVPPVGRLRGPRPHGPATSTTRSSSACSRWASPCRAWRPGCPRPRRASSAAPWRRSTGSSPRCAPPSTSSGWARRAAASATTSPPSSRQLDAVVGFEVDVDLRRARSTPPSTDRVLEHLLATIREALTNVGKHAHATRASVERGGGRRRGAPDHHRRRRRHSPERRAAAGGGLGLPNLRRRAEKLHGTLVVRQPTGRRDRPHVEGAARHLPRVTGTRTRTTSRRRSSHDTPHEAPGTGRIVVGIDGSPSSLDALSWAARQADLTGSTLEVVMTWEWPSSYGWAVPGPRRLRPRGGRPQGTRDRRRGGARRASGRRIDPRVVERPSGADPRRGFEGRRPARRREPGPRRVRRDADRLGQRVLRDERALPRPRAPGHRLGR